MIQKKKVPFLQLGAPIVSTILLEDILVTLNSKTAILKIDVETMECKVYYKFINEVMLNSLQSLFFIRFLSILTNFLIPQESSFPISS
jgi:predicted cation transporter